MHLRNLVPGDAVRASGSGLQSRHSGYLNSPYRLSQVLCRRHVARSKPQSWSGMIRGMRLAKLRPRRWEVAWNPGLEE